MSGKGTSFQPVKGPTQLTPKVSAVTVKCYHLGKMESVPQTTRRVMLTAAFRKGRCRRNPDAGTWVDGPPQSPRHLPAPSLSSYRITIGNKTCVFEKENDPTVLRAPSAGKLIQYMVEDGAHIKAGGSYAEIEVTAELAPWEGGRAAARSPLHPLPQGGPSANAASSKPTDLPSHLGCHLQIPKRAMCVGFSPNSLQYPKGKKISKMYTPPRSE